ncbi:hypothetical protein HDU76_002535 [Blyttiomyces sp. JEL0837]|nr:hypothetical protein HDU76_002535 [Blyttiomyces sp. JEL0837]
MSPPSSSSSSSSSGNMNSPIARTPTSTSNSTVMQWPGSKVENPARPAKMSITVGRLKFPLRQVSGIKTTAQLKFRGKETKTFEIAGSGLKPLDQSVVSNFVMTYHGHLFDKLKVDVFEGESSLFKKPVHTARGRLGLSDMDDWHYGSYTRVVPLHFPKDPNAPVGTIELNFQFSAIFLPNETPTDQDLRENLEEDEAESDIEDREEEEFVDANDLAAELMDTVVLSGDQQPVSSPSMARSKSSTGTTTIAIPPSGTGGATPEQRRKFLRAGTVKDLTKSIDRHETITTSDALSSSPTIMSSNTVKPRRGKSVDLGDRSLSIPTEPVPNSYSLRRKSVKNGGNQNGDDSSSSSSPTTKRALTLPKPRLISENAMGSLSEINSMTLSQLKNDFRVPPVRLVKSIRFLYKFENGLPIPRTGKIIKDVELLQTAVRFMAFSLCTYGALVLGFCNGTMNFRDNLRLKADEKTTMEYLGLELKDMLYWDHGKREIGRSRYYICHDTTQKAIIIACQGTIHLAQVLTDLNAEYFPVGNNGGAAHVGILRAAQAIVDTHFESLLKWAKELDIDAIYCTGHSLGGGTAAITTILLLEQLEKFKEATGKPDFKIRGHCIATPSVANHALADPHEDYINNYIMENDIVPRLSFGSLYGFKDMVVEADKILESGIPEEEAFAALQAKRVEILKENKALRGIIPGRVFHIYKTVRKVPRRHHERLNISVPFYETAYRSVALPPEEKPEIPHYVMELARPEFFSYVAPRRHIFNHHLPWAYSKGIEGARDWLIQEGVAEE